MRRERRQSPRGEADADFQRAKSELIRLRIAEKQRTLVPIDEALTITDQIVGVMLTAMGGMPARIGGRDLELRRLVERVVFETRVAISEAASKMGELAGEPKRKKSMREMTDRQVTEQIRRADAFTESARRHLVNDIIPRTSRRRATAGRFVGLPTRSTRCRFVAFANLSNLDLATNGVLMSLIEVELMVAGSGRDLDHADAAAFLRRFQPMIDVVLKRKIN